MFRRTCAKIIPNILLASLLGACSTTGPKLYTPPQNHDLASVEITDYFAHRGVDDGFSYSSYSSTIEVYSGDSCPYSKESNAEKSSLGTLLITNTEPSLETILPAGKTVYLDLRRQKTTHVSTTFCDKSVRLQLSQERNYRLEFSGEDCSGFVLTSTSKTGGDSASHDVIVGSHQDTALCP